MSRAINYPLKLWQNLRPLRYTAFWVYLVIFWENQYQLDCLPTNKRCSAIYIYFFFFQDFIECFCDRNMFKLWRGLMSNKSVKTGPSFQDCEVRHEVYPRFRKKKSLSWCNSNDDDWRLISTNFEMPHSYHRHLLKNKKKSSVNLRWKCGHNIALDLLNTFKRINLR